MMNTTPMHFRGGMTQHHPHTPTPRQSSSSNVNHRRGPPPMISHNTQSQPTQAQIQQQQAAARAAELEQAKRRSKKPTDKTISAAIEEICPTASIYNDMRRVEKRLDAAIMRKRLDITDSVNRNVKNYRTLRVWISNTAVNQPWQATSRLDENSFDFDTGLIPSYKMRIEGRYLDDDDEVEHTISDDDSDDDDGMEDDEKRKDSGATMEVDGQPSSSKPKSNKPFSDLPKPSRKFSKFIKSLTVEVDKMSFDNLNDSSNVEWNKYPIPNQPVSKTAPAPIQPEFDAIEFERKLDLNAQCIIKIVRDDQPERFKLSPQLADLLDTQEDTKGGVVVGIWDYVMSHNLQERDEKRNIIPDEKLRAVFNVDRIYFPNLPDMVTAHCSPLEPLTFKYNIRVDIPSTGPSVYDILIPVDDPLRAKMSALISSTRDAQSIRTLINEDENIALLVQQLNYSKAKYDFWVSMSEDPATFINRWVASQKRDLEVILGDKGVDSEESRRARFYTGNLVEENVYMLLHGKDVPNGMRG